MWFDRTPAATDSASSSDVRSSRAIAQERAKTPPVVPRES